MSQVIVKPALAEPRESSGRLPGGEVGRISSMQHDEAEGSKMTRRDDPEGPVTRFRPSVSLALQPKNLHDFIALCKWLSSANSAVVPKEMRGDYLAVAGALEIGDRAGLGIFESLQNVGFKKGKFTMQGERMIALILNSGKLADREDVFEGEGESLKATCRMWRHGIQRPYSHTFSVQDARRAGLWGKDGPWRQYPKRMLMIRARSFVMRELFTDVLSGLMPREEVDDYPADMAADAAPHLPKPNRQMPTVKEPDLPMGAPAPATQQPAAPAPPVTLEQEEEDLEAKAANHYHRLIDKSHSDEMLAKSFPSVEAAAQLSPNRLEALRAHYNTKAGTYYHHLIDKSQSDVMLAKSFPSAKAAAPLAQKTLEDLRSHYKAAKAMLAQRQAAGGVDPAGEE